MSIRIIVAGRHRILSESLAIALSQVQDIEATHLRDWATAEWILEESPDVLLVDLADAQEELQGLVEAVTREGQKVLAFGFGFRNTVDASVEWASPETSLAGLVQMIRSSVAQGGKGRPQ